MAYIHRCLVIVLSFVALSLSQQDPIGSFCRRWGHRTALIDSRLYFDGGMIGATPFTSNYSNTYLLFSDLNTSIGDGSMPAQHANLSKPGNIPSVSGGYIWSDNTNKCFYQIGGEYPDAVPPAEFSVWTYDVLLNQWNTTETTGERALQRVAFGAGTEVESRGLGFYFGGWLSSRTTLEYDGPPIATSGLVRFDMSTGELKNISGPDDIGRAEGDLFFLPVSDGGMLIYFGGIEDSYHNGSYDAADMSNIHMYDLASSKWYTQTATGDIPLSRRQFCAGVTWPEDRSSYNIYLYGGYGFGDKEAFDDIYILSIPSFTWIKAFPEDKDSVPTEVGHGGCSANVVNKAQMLVVGGWFPSYNKCDAEAAQGQHNAVLGYNGKEKKLWDQYDPKLSTYAVPPPVISAIGGGPTGGATKTAPASWGHVDLATYYTLKPSFSARAATRPVPSPTTTESLSPGDSKKTNVAAIAGGTVGGLVGLIAILGLILFCLRRRKKALKRESNTNNSPPPPPPPAELETTVPHEMAASDASKYVSIHEQANHFAQSHHPGQAQQHSHSASHDYNSPYPGNSPPSYGYAPSYSSPTEGGHNQYSPHTPGNTELFPTSHGTSPGSSPTAWGQQANYPQSGTTAQSQYPYPSPTSPSREAIQQQVPIHHSRPSDLASRPQASPTATQYSGEGQPRTASTTNTPTQSYAQSGMDGGSTRDRRPIHGRFMEGDHM